MKKVVLLFILFVFSLSQADAQEFHFIPRIGLNLANTYPESFADMRPGLNIGVAEEIRFSKLFALEPGVYYSMQGYQQENAKGETARLKADYLNIPVYAKFYLYRGFHLFAGPQVGFNVRAKASNYIFVSAPTPVHQSEYDFSGDKKEEIRINRIKDTSNFQKGYFPDTTDADNTRLRTPKIYVIRVIRFSRIY